jgi:hypothetical protein
VRRNYFSQFTNDQSTGALPSGVPLGLHISPFASLRSEDVLDRSSRSRLTSAMS